MPLACGMPPIPGDCSITRLLSVMANCPSRKKPSRGVVAIQFGLPRPAFKNADCDVREVSLAKLMSSFLISNGLKVSNFRSVRRSAMTCSLFYLVQDAQRLWRGRLGQQHDEDHSPDRQQCISDRVGHGVA